MAKGEIGAIKGADQAGMPADQAGERIDVAVNIFAKPYQTALSLLSLVRFCGQHINVLWLQFEPFGSRHDKISPYSIVPYLVKELGLTCYVYQPEHWIDLRAADTQRFDDAAYRLGIRYQYAFEHSKSRLLFLMHNDVLIFKDILGEMRSTLQDAFAVGHLGQCWNCPASHAALMSEVLGRPVCGPQNYADFQPNYEDLCKLYAAAEARGIFVRPYAQGFTGIFDAQPWPLPECRINEWACLLDLGKIRSHCVPHGPVLPPGAYRQCGPICLDIGVELFRGMHARGMHARHFEVASCLTHWVGTGKVTPRRYALAEDNALSLLQKHYPNFLRWLAETGSRS